MLLLPFLLLPGFRTTETGVFLSRTGLRCAAGLSPPSAATTPGVVNMPISRNTTQGVLIFSSRAVVGASRDDDLLLNVVCLFVFLLFFNVLFLLSGRETKETNACLSRIGLRCLLESLPPSAATTPDAVNMSST